MKRAGQEWCKAAITLLFGTLLIPTWSFSIHHGKRSQLRTRHLTMVVLHMGSDDVGEKKGNEVFYSPNIELDESRYRYDLGDYGNGDEETASMEQSSTNEYSFFDEAVIFVRAGSGGQGASTYQKYAGGQDGPPDGGSGGKGGNVVLEVDESLNTLAGLTQAWRPNSFGGSGAATKTQHQSFRPKSFRAPNGADGQRQFKNGKYGKDVYIRVPPGTVVQEEIDEVEVDEETGKRNVIATFTRDMGTVAMVDNDDGQSGKRGEHVKARSLVVAYGGTGGEGSGIAAPKRGVQRVRAPPEGGERKRLKLTLKIVADVALVGVPNAGKSTFLASVTRAKPKIANYPFTTLIPNLGVWIPSEEEQLQSYQSGVSIDGGSSGLILCDVPGLIAGAAEGVGLGHAFLRHVERCHVILHLVDATSSDPVGDFHMLNREIMRYGNGKLAQMPQIVVVNKVDAYEGRGNEEWEEGLKTKMSREELETKLREAMTHSRLMWMSAKEKEGVDDLMGRMSGFVKKVKETSNS